MPGCLSEFLITPDRLVSHVAFFNGARFCIVTLLLLTSISSPAVSLPDQLAEGIRRCVAEPDREKRLDCFDALGRALPSLETDKIGMTRAITQRREPAEPPAQPVQVVGKIVALRLAAADKLVFTLDNGQVWEQAEASSRVRFTVGEVVHVEPGSMGSLWLAADKGRKTRVKRLS
jgi:hypothetical protein